jgi:hypothetical protein
MANGESRSRLGNRRHFTGVDVAPAAATGRSAGGEKTRSATAGGRKMLGTILIVILILILLGAIPNWGYSRGWGYGPSGIVGVLLIIVVILLLTGRI